MSILDRKNFVADENWYRVGDQIAWFDKHVKSWTTYMVNDKGHQISASEYYANKRTFQDMEKKGFSFDMWEE